jgi:hypothetical protein
MTRTRKHMSLSVEGALKNWKASRWRNCVIDPATGRYLSPAAVRDWLFEQHGKGVKLVPMSDECEGHDPINGCPGHVIADDAP